MFVHDAQILDSPTAAAFHQDFKLLAVTLMGMTKLIEMTSNFRSRLSVAELGEIAEGVEHGQFRNMLQALLSRTV